jgi:integrase
MTNDEPQNTPKTDPQTAKKSAPKWIGKWKYGRIKRSKDGSAIYVLEKKINGKRYVKTLPDHIKDEDDALGEWGLFKRNPDKYCHEQRKEIRTSIPALTEENIGSFCADKHAEGLSKEHVENVLRHYLLEWLDLFEGREFGGDSKRLAEAQAWLKKAERNPKTGKLVRKRGIGKRIVALKSFSKWLRQGGPSIEACLDRKDDWTLDLVCPETKRVKSIEEKAYRPDHVAAIYAKISPWSYKAGTGTRESDVQGVRDVIRIAAHTGMHLSEISRLARQRDEAGELVGRVERLDNQPHPIAGAFTVWHKNGVPHRIAVDQATYEAGLRLQAKGRAPEKSYVHKVLDRAAKLAGQPEIEPGSLRHSFVSWGNAFGVEVRVNGTGVSAATMAQVAGHSLQTNMKHYRLATEPLIVLPLLKLEHPDDPRPEETPSKPLKVAG